MGVRDEFSSLVKPTGAQPVQQKQQDQGLIGFLRGAGSSIANTYNRVGQGTAEVINEFTGANQRQRDAKKKQNEEDLKMIRALGERKKSAKTEEEKQRVSNALKSINNTIDKQDNAFIQRQQEIAERTDPIKGAAAVGSIGLDVLSGGTLGNLAKQGILKTAARGAAQGAVTGAGQGALQTLQDKGAQATAEDVLGSGVAGGVLGGVAGGALSGVANIPSAIQRGLKKGVLSKAGKKLEGVGNNLLGTQANLTRAEGRKIGANPSDVLGSIQKRTGVSNVDTASRVASNITGENGVYSELVRNAIGNSRGVDIGDLRNFANSAIEDTAPLLSKSQRNNVLEQVKNGVTSTYGGSKGSLSTLANPLDALSLSQNYRSLAADIKRGASVSAADKQLAKVYDNLAGEIEKRLYKTPGIQEGLKAAAPDRAADLRRLAAGTSDKAEAKAYNKLASELENPNLTVKELRSLQSDFVKLSKIDEASARANSGAAAQLGDTMQGLGRFVQKPTNMLAIPLNAQTPRVGGILSNVGRKMQEATGPALPEAPEALSQAVGAAARVPLARGIGEASQAPENVPQDQGAEDLGYDTSAIYQGELPQESANQSPFSSDNIQKLIIADLAANEGKNVSTLLSLYETFGKSAEPELTSKQQESQARAQAGITALDQIEQAFNEAGGGQSYLGNLTSLAGSLKLNPQAEAYNKIRNSAISLIARGLGGSAQGSDRDRADIEQALPSLTDTPEAARIKIQALRDRLSAGSLSAAPDELTTGVAQ